MQIEELSAYHKNAQEDNRGDKGKEKDKGNRQTSGQFDKFKDNRGPRFHTYTPLNSDRGKIMDETLHADLISALKKLPSPKEFYLSKQCCYHHNFGHMIEECKTLNDKIEELVQIGHLRKFVQRTSRNSYRSP